MCLATAKHFCFPIIWVYSSIFLFPYGSTWPRARELDIWTHQQALSAQSYEEKKTAAVKGACGHWCAAACGVHHDWLVGRVGRILRARKTERLREGAQVRSDGACTRGWLYIYSMTYLLFICSTKV